MDLLDDLLGSMEAPPKKSAQEKKRQEVLKQRNEEEKQVREKLQSMAWETIQKFKKEAAKVLVKFPPMENLERKIVHEIAAEHDITALSFGEEGISRQLILFRAKEPFTTTQLELMDRTLPYEECMRALRDSEKAAKEFEERKKRSREESDEGEDQEDAKKAQTNSRYREKMQRMAGQDALVAKAPSMQKSFGMVSSELKQDTRTIEQTLKDIKAKKLKRAADAAAADKSQDNGDSPNDEV